RMTRFWITLDQAVAFVLSCLERMDGGELFVPRIPSMRIVDLARAVAPECKLNYVGIRPGEKLHEVMIPEDESRNCVRFDDSYVILPAHYGVDTNTYRARHGGTPCPEGFSYSSDRNTHWLSTVELRAMVSAMSPDAVREPLRIAA
ncbi:MAG: polysaccharide biosynthesis protein, partial [Candidatus Acidiferrum sp.]